MNGSQGNLKEDLQEYRVTELARNICEQWDIGLCMAHQLTLGIETCSLLITGCNVIWSCSYIGTVQNLHDWPIPFSIVFTTMFLQTWMSSSLTLTHTGSVVVHRGRSKCSDSGHFPPILHTQHCGSQSWEAFSWSNTIYIVLFPSQSYGALEAIVHTHCRLFTHIEWLHEPPICCGQSSRASCMMYYNIWLLTFFMSPKEIMEVFCALYKITIWFLLLLYTPFNWHASSWTAYS